MASKSKIAVLTGAGISAESGISTFRDSNGLWENHDIMEVASYHGWLKNKGLVLNFYNDRRRQLKEVQPNVGHLGLVELASQFDVTVITQNVDDLHERAGSKNIIHLHGELNKARSTTDERLVYDWFDDLKIGDLCEKGSQLRPHIVWFGEMVPLLDIAANVVENADIVVIIGTSMQVYPAASLVDYANFGIPIYYIDPKPAINTGLKMSNNFKVIEEPATIGVQLLLDELM
ncbi:MAG: Sir2 family NAD-dependent protein deacetylase [Saprospiraceae bacterium]